MGLHSKGMAITSSGSRGPLVGQSGHMMDPGASAAAYNGSMGASSGSLSGKTFNGSVSRALNVSHVMDQ